MKERTVAGSEDSRLEILFGPKVASYIKDLFSSVFGVSTGQKPYY